MDLFKRAAHSYLKTKSISKHCLVSRTQTDIGLSVLRGWRFRAFPAVARQSRQLRKVFAFAPHIESVANRLIASQRLGGLPLLGVHIRQTDYRLHLGGKNFFDIDQYMALARQAEDRHGRHRLILFSDGSVSKGVNFPDEATIAAELPIVAWRDLVELSMMAKCDRLIGPHSSFNQWASFLGATPLQTIERAGDVPTLTEPRVALPLDFGCRDATPLSGN